MTATGTNRPPHAPNTGRLLLRGVGALALLVALAFGPPAALLAFIGNPIPAQPVVGGRLTDAAVIGMLAVVVWAAWAQLMLAVLVEAAAALRSAPLPARIPFTGPQQHLARHLVLAVSFLLAGSGTLLLPTSAVPAAAAVATCAAPETAQDRGHDTEPEPAAELTSHQIPAAREQVTAAAVPPQSAHRDGVRLARPEATAPPHAAQSPVSQSPVSQSPASQSPASQSPASQSNATTERAGRWYVVKPPRGSHHDTLWDIAERHLGDGLRWKEIYELNRGRSQPGGGELQLPRLIHPGWRLLLPPDATGLPKPGGETSKRSTPAAKDADERAGQPGAPSADHLGDSADHFSDPSTGQRLRLDQAKERDLQTSKETGVLAVPPAPERAEDSPPAAIVPTLPRPTPPATTVNETDRAEAPAFGPDLAPDHHLADDDPADDGPGLPVGVLTLGLGALACAGLTAELTRRRRRGQRFRRPGERLRHPGGPASDLQRQLHAANAELTATALRDALRALAAACHAGGHALPDLHTVRINAAGATLHLGSDTPAAVPPFTRVDARTWTLDAAGADAIDGDDSDDADDVGDFVDPYPALVALGVTGDEAILLINLEAAGTLQITGPPEGAEAILHALAAELGTSDLTRTTGILVSGCPAPLLRILEPGRARAVDAAAGRRRVAVHQREVEALLTSADTGDLLTARARCVLDDLWAPMVLIDGGRHDDSNTVEVPTRPYGGGCLITTRAGLDEENPAWTLTKASETWRLEPPGIDLDPQCLDPERLAQLDALLAVTDVPDPDPQEPATPARNGAGPIPAPSPAEPTPTPQMTPQMTVHDVSAVNGAPVASPTSLAIIAAAIPDSSGRSQPPADAHLAGPLAGPLAPRVFVLGPVEVLGAGEEVKPGRRRRAEELIAYLALHPGASQHQLDEALWPGVRVSRGTRNPLVSRARQWLGVASDGQPYLALVTEGQRYQLRAEVRCDWHEFCALAKRGLAAGPDGLDDLHAALELVRGRPFLGVNPAAYGWADADTQDMISAIVDVAHTLASFALAGGDHRRARWAAARGINAEPVAELLYRDAIRAAQAAGDDQDATRLLDQLRRCIAELDPDDDITDATAVTTGILGAR
ncbi:BTAD domain-containing putative transcriptional regulator [Sporichthya polymorpha]|uniref:BTAD domain-containing putative transcriptional regulator n=1 Tax=Sporichthya polymorpha TaxID=35751 RepID=UPI00037221B6|nr:BTAD domain-containing putative transcriptional regulator [Sporichthya polymorpha]